jgi:hypothetical protein
MRRWIIAVALGAALLLPVASGADAVEEGEEGGGEAAEAAPAAAEDEESGAEEAAAQEAEGAEAEEEEAEDEEPGFWAEHLESMRTRFLTGANGIATAPADPVMATVEPPKALEKASYGRYPLGFASGTLLMLYRTFLGAVDLGLAPIPAFPVLSPVPRYKLIPGFQHEDE